MTKTGGGSFYLFVGLKLLEKVHYSDISADDLRNVIKLSNHRITSNSKPRRSRVSDYRQHAVSETRDPHLSTVPRTRHDRPVSSCNGDVHNL